MCMPQMLPVGIKRTPFLLFGEFGFQQNGWMSST